MPMLYMDDAIKATLALMEAPKEDLTVHTSYNLGGMSFTPTELSAEIKKEIPDFEIDYKPDFRQEIANSWPASIDDSVAKKDWGLSYDFGISEMTKDMLKNLKVKLNKNWYRLKQSAIQSWIKRTFSNENNLQFRKDIPEGFADFFIHSSVPKFENDFTDF